MASITIGKMSLELLNTVADKNAQITFIAIPSTDANGQQAKRFALQWPNAAASGWCE